MRRFAAAVLLLAASGCASPYVASGASVADGGQAARGGASGAAARLGSADDLAAQRAGERADAWPAAPVAQAAALDQLEKDEQGAKLLEAFSGSFKMTRFAKVDAPLYRGSLPSKADLAELKAMGVKTDIDLLGEVPVFDTFLVAREKRWAREVGVKFVQIKIPTGKVPFSGKMNDALADQFLKVVADPANQPCFVHCLHGRDRTGTMAAVYRMARNGYTNAQAEEEMRGFGFSADAYPALAAYVAAYKPSPR